MVARVRLVCLLTATLAIAALVGASGAEAKRCGQVDFAYRSSGEKVEGSMSVTAASGIGCSGARTVARECGVRNRVSGWSAIGSITRFELRRGNRRIAIRPIAGAAPKCAP